MSAENDHLERVSIHLRILNIILFTVCVGVVVMCAGLLFVGQRDNERKIRDVEQRVRKLEAHQSPASTS